MHSFSIKSRFYVIQNINTKKKRYISQIFTSFSPIGDAIEIARKRKQNAFELVEIMTELFKFKGFEFLSDQ